MPKSIPLILIAKKNYNGWIKKQPARIKNWLATSGFSNEPLSYGLLPQADGKLQSVVAIIDNKPDLWSIAHLPTLLPVNSYSVEGKLSKEEHTQLALGWKLACYEFTRYKKSTKKWPKLVTRKSYDNSYVDIMAKSLCWGRDLINTPANDMNPDALAKEAVDWAKSAKAKVKVISGKKLLTENYPMIYTVGKASDIPPHLVDIRFARKNAPKVTLVGKGVCFDTGGLDIKPTDGMKIMKKDMGGAACVLALAKAIIDSKLAVQLRVLLPIVENSVSANAMRPLDIVPTRKGISVEIGNTDAEGRLILCDALTEADNEKPDLLIDCATLTGAARIALGADVPAFFTHDDKLASDLCRSGQSLDDPLWRLPLWKGYKNKLNTQNADISNDPESGYGGAITAALYLDEFVSKTASWLHIDMMAWNLLAKAGRPKGGEVMAVRALHDLIKERYGC